VAVSTGGIQPAELFRLADAAQYTSKRTGRGRISVAQRSNAGRPDPGPGHAPGTRSPWRVFRDRRPGTTDELLVGALAVLDGPLAGGDALARLEAVAVQCASSVDASAWSVSGLAAGATVPEVLLEAILRLDGDAAGSPGGRPARSALGLSCHAERAVQRETAFTIHLADADLTADARTRLDERSAGAVLMAGARHPSGGFLLELFADERSSDLHAAEPAVRLLVLEAVHGAGRPI
jgi:hypothetical protein